MNALVIGYGSIGARHARILLELGCCVGVVSKRKIEFKPCYRTISEAVAAEKPEYAVVATNTHEHYAAIRKLDETGFKGTVLVEKPIFFKLEVPRFRNLNRVLVAYNLRFHPLIQRLKNILKGEKLISAQIYVGKYLPEWRPGAAYTDSYSARKNLGGGVLRDLSHELDYLNWMFEGWERLTALGGHFSHLDIDSDDVFSILMVTKKCPIVSVQMNYLDRVSRREIVINSDAHTFKLDLNQGTLQTDARTETFSTERDLTYRLQHQAILNGDFQCCCSLDEGLDVMKMIEAAEKSANKKKWIQV